MVVKIYSEIKHVHLKDIRPEVVEQVERKHELPCRRKSRCLHIPEMDASTLIQSSRFSRMQATRIYDLLRLSERIRLRANPRLVCDHCKKIRTLRERKT